MPTMLIRQCSLTSDPPGTERYLEVDTDNPSTGAGKTIIIRDGKRIEIGQENRTDFVW